jgi:hypothetical protein
MTLGLGPRAEREGGEGARSELRCRSYALCKTLCSQVAVGVPTSMVAFDLIWLVALSLIILCEEVDQLPVAAVRPRSWLKWPIPPTMRGPLRSWRRTP